MAKFDLHKATGLNNVMNAVQQVKNVNGILPLTEAKELLIENLYPSVENFYAVEELDELSDSIRELGILQPLLVTERDSGQYEIIAGNRRYEAAKIAGLERLPCIIKQNVEPALFKIMLIHANMFRVKTDLERAQEIAELKKAIVALKAIDKTIKGRTGEIAGQILNLSYRQVNRLDNLNKLIPEIQGLVQHERLTASCAEQFAHLEAAVQKEIYEALIASGMDINRQEAAKIKEEYLARNQAEETRRAADMDNLQTQIRLAQAQLEEKEAALADLAERLQAHEQEAQEAPGTQHERETPEAPATQHDRETSAIQETQTSASQRELEKVKQALVAALQDRQALEERYNALSAQGEREQRETHNHGTSGHGTSSHEVPNRGTSNRGTSNHGTSNRGMSGHGVSGYTAADAPTPTLYAANAEQLLNDVKRKVQLQECISRLKLVAQSYADYKHLYRLTAPIAPPAAETEMHNEIINTLRLLTKLVTGNQHE